MKPRTLLILLVLVVGLGSFIAFYERDLPGSEEREKQAKKIFDFTPADVHAVTIEHGGVALALERAEKPKAEAAKKSASPASSADSEATPPAPATAAEWPWRILRPLRAKADAGAVGRLIDSLTGLEKSRTLESVDPKAVGLARPEAKVRLATAKGERVLEIGAKVPTGSSRIVRFQGEKTAYVVSDAFWNDLLREPGEWRDHQIFPGDRESIERITLQPAGGSPVVLSRRDGVYWVQSPLSDRADRDLVDALLSDLTGLAADRFIEAPAVPAEMGLEPPKKGSIEIALAGRREPFRIELGSMVGGAADGETPASYARAEGETFTTRARLGDSLGRGAEDWRSRALSSLEVYQVDRAKIDGAAASTLEVERAGSDWKRGKETISYAPVSDLLYALTELRADRLLSPAEAKAAGVDLAAKPALSIDLSGEAGRRETLRFYPAVSGGLPARAEGREAILLLPEGKLAEIQRKIAEVRASKPISASETQGAKGAEGGKGS
ncbi:MAG TPA: DUF4340 domain-containing protein [Thermoanaerobaculia bacterium]|nr:DUF4340 domain-containing protein [Thermoanaerobaculia bacterium]